MNRRYIFFLLAVFLLTKTAPAGVPVRPGIPIYCVTVEGKLYADKKDIMDEWLKENDLKLINSDKSEGEAFTLKDKAGGVRGYVIIDRNSSMKHAWDTDEIDDNAKSADLAGYKSLLAKFKFDMGEACPGFTITNLKVYGPR